HHLIRPRLTLLFSLPPHPPTPTLFPYTTLFRSRCRPSRLPAHRRARRRCHGGSHRAGRRSEPAGGDMAVKLRLTRVGSKKNPIRSEEHTSELQSRGHLVCRLLLEKKNKKSSTRR